jgi:hypothetical protein
MASQIDTKEGRDWLRGVLQMHETTIVFTKKDGEKREMRCTLNEELMKKNATPDLYEVKGAGRKSSEDVQVVFDLDKLAWRSFRFDSITSVHFNLQ